MKRVAAIDPGVSTGVAIADITLQAYTADLKRIVLLTTEDPYEVIQLVKSCMCFSVVLERRPVNASRIGTTNYEIIYQGLLKENYVDRSHFWFTQFGLARIYPGLYKPVMKSQPSDTAAWQPQTAHERDALNLLRYTAKLNYMTRSIVCTWTQKEIQNG